MQVIKCDMFNECKNGDAICVTTNGIVNNGKLIMGAGIAKAFRDKFKGIDKKLGSFVEKYGNRVFRIGDVSIKVDGQPDKIVTALSFPTKYNWKDKSDSKSREIFIFQPQVV